MYMSTSSVTSSSGGVVFCSKAHVCQLLNLLQVEVFFYSKDIHVKILHCT